jgi:hypothetical protein
LHLFYSDVIYLQDGSEYSGSLLSLTHDKVIFATDDNQYTFNRIDVFRIDLSQKREGSDYKSLSDITDPTLLSLVEKSRKPDFSDSSGRTGFVYLLKSKTITLTDETHVISETRICGLITSELGRSAGMMTTDFFSDVSKVSIIRALSINKDDEVFDLDDSAIEFGHPFGNLSLYDRLRRLKFVLSDLSTGSVIDVIIREETFLDQPSAFQGFYDYLYDFHPILEYHVELKQPITHKDFLKLNLLGTDQKIIFEQEKDGFLTTGFTITNIPELVKETLMPPVSYISPSYSVRLADEFNSLKNLFERFSIPDKDDSTVIKKILSDNGVNNQLPKKEIERKLFNYIVENISIKEPSVIESGYLPNRAKDIISKGYSNPRDATWLFHLFLLFSDIESEIGFARNVMLYPKPLDFALTPYSVMILKTKDGYYSINDRFAYLNDLPDEVRGSEAFFLFENPQSIQLTGGLENTIKRKIKISRLSDSLATILITTDYTGSTSIEIKRLLSEPEYKKRNILNEMVFKLSPECKLDSFRIFQNEDNQITTTSLYLSSKTVYIKNDDSFLMKIPTFFDFIISGTGRDTRVNPIFIQHLKTISVSITADFPEGCTAKELPQNFDLSIDGLSFNSSFSSNDKTIEVKILKKTTKNMLSPSDWEELKQIENASFQLKNEVIFSLKKNDNKDK